MSDHKFTKTKSRNSYLDMISFDPKLLRGFAAQYLTNFRLVSLFIIGIIGFGLFGFLNLPRRVNPEVKIPIVFVSTILPGASPEDVESLITIPLEDAIQSISGIDSLSSTSNESFGTIVVEFESSIDPKEAKRDVQDAVDTISDLPEDATEPNVQELDFEDVPVWTFAVLGEEDLPSLFRFSEELKQRIENIPSINKAIISGLESQEIQVLVQPEKLTEYGISPFEISSAIKAEINSYPGGAIDSNGTILNITIDPQIDSINDIRNIKLNIKNEQYKLSDIATIAERSTPNQAKSYYAKSGVTPTRSVTFNVFKLQSADIDATSAQVHQEVKKVLEEFDNHFQVISIEDSGQKIDDQFNKLYNNLLATVILVFITLFIFLGIKQATIASLTIPLTFLISFGIMQATGLSLNFLSMFSLLIALGLVVDDAIVIISATTSYYRTAKFTPRETGVLVWRDFIVPIWTTTITTVWAFIPLLLAGGIIGEFIKSIPLVVTYTLLASTSTAVLITLPLMIVILKPMVPSRVTSMLKVIISLIILISIWSLLKTNPLQLPVIITAVITLITFFKLRKQIKTQIKKVFKKKNKDNHLTKIKKISSKILFEGIINSQKISQKYGEIIDNILKNKKFRVQTIIIVITFFIFSITLIPLGYVENIFFPKTDEDVIYLQNELPTGTNLATTTNEALSILNDIKDTPDVEHIILEVGSRASQDSTATQTETNVMKFSLTLFKDRKNTSIDIAQKLRKQFKNYQKGEISVVEVSGGPPVGSDIQLKIIGPELDQLNNYADKLTQYMNTQPGLINIEKSIKQGTSKISFVPNQTKVVEAGLTIDQVGFWIRTYASGFKLDDVKFTTEEDQPVIFRLSSDLQSPEDLSSLEIPTPNGPVPLLQLGKLELRPNPTKITREDDNRTISVSAGTEPGVNAGEANANLVKYAKENLDLGNQYQLATGGANEENQKSVISIIQAMFLAFILILGTMVIQLKSFRKSIIVLLVIPLAMSGVFILFALTGIPLSFPALIGVLALFGIVVNNSIVVVEKINQNLDVGIPFRESISDAAASRLEPILFSSLTTIIGLIPITLTDPMWEGLGGAIISGLTFSGIVMLFFIPVMYYVIYAKELGEKN